MTTQNPSNKLSRRNWLRDAAIAATGAAVMPSLLISCSDHTVPPGTGLGGQADEPLTDFELYSAAQNLLRMEAWLSDFYLYSLGYELEAYALIKSGKAAPSNFKDFVLDLLINIATGFLEAAVEEIPFVGPVFAITIETTKSWLKANKPQNLVNGVFAEFVSGHNDMHKAFSDALLSLADRRDNYSHLREGWKGEIDFNGKKYTLRDLAGAQFPDKALGNEFKALRDAAYTKFKKDFWNVMIIKAGKMEYSSYWTANVNTIDSNEKRRKSVPIVYARESFYKDYKACYLRGWYDNLGTIYYRYWHFTFDGLELSEDAGTKLFMDDTPGHIINKEGLFNRDYVFKQFHTEKPNFFGYNDMKKDKDYDEVFHFSNAKDFDESDFDFTGGLIKK